MQRSKNRIAWKIVVASLGVCLCTIPGFAKRMPPKPVPPVVSAGIRYSAIGDGRDQFVIAENATSGAELWRVRIFHNRVKFWVEEDVQWVFITGLKIVGNELFVRDEKGRCYSVRLANRHLKNRTCDGIY